MKAKLETRKQVRLPWFKQHKVPFKIQRELEWQYSQYSAENNDISHTINMNYQFEGLEQLIPETDLIIFDKRGLPQAYMKTEGSIGNKFSTNQVADHELEVRDRIISLKKGENKVSKQPVPPHETHLYKEIQIHEREDVIKRKLTLKNRTNKSINPIELKFVENKDVSFIKSNPEVKLKNAPEYQWIISIEAESEVILELEIKVMVIAKYKIEKEKKEKTIPPTLRNRVANQAFNQTDDSF